jgi:MATE family multidrug resistance protein
VRVGQAVGRGDAAGMRRAGIAAVALAAAFMAGMTLVVALFRHPIPALFLGAEVAAGAAADSAALAATLLALGATFFITDGMQTVTAGALRGLNDTRVPLAIAALSYWGAGVPVSYGLAFAAGLDAIGVWIGLSVGTTTFAVLLIWRFHALTRAGHLAEAERAWTDK